MSLDVSLSFSGPSGMQSEARIFIRKDGATRTISREEWNIRFPGKEPVTVDLGDTNEVYSGNITHNLNKMAEAAGIYTHLWRPEEIGITQAKELIEPLTVGLERLRSDRTHFEQFNAPNGWGKYQDFVGFVSEYLEACKQYPEATVSVSR